MKLRIGTIIGWISTLLIVAFHVPAIIGKFVTPEPGSFADQFAIRVGMRGLETQLGILQIIILILFLIPRTSTVGWILMVGYTAGILSANITHGFTFMETIPLYVVFLLLMITAWFRNPELIARLLKRPMKIG